MNNTNVLTNFLNGELPEVPVSVSDDTLLKLFGGIVITFFVVLMMYKAVK